jgi:hypothetical protein
MSETLRELPRRRDQNERMTTAPGRRIRCRKCRAVVYVYATPESDGTVVTLDETGVFGLVGPGPGEGMPRAMWAFHRCGAAVVHRPAKAAA